MEEPLTASQKNARDVGASSRTIQAAKPGTSAWNAEEQAIRDEKSIPWRNLGKFGPLDAVASEHLVWFQDGMVFKATA
jgi:hypothetical protein